MLWNRRLTLAFVCGMLIPAISCLTAVETESPANHPPASPPEPATASVCRDDDSGTSSQTNPPPPPLPGGLATMQEDAGQELAIREILQFRHQQGGLFRGTMLDDMDAAEADKAFLQALRNVVRQQVTPSDQATDPATVSDRTRACEAAYTRQMMQRSSVIPPIVRQPSGASDETLAKTLRQAYRALDRKAGDLEDAHEYSTAFQLRDLSNELKKQAQRWADPELLAPAGQAGR